MASYSSDLNPIENIRENIKHYLESRAFQAFQV